MHLSRKKPVRAQHTKVLKELHIKPFGQCMLTQQRKKKKVMQELELTPGVGQLYLSKLDEISAALSCFDGEPMDIPEYSNMSAY